MSVLFSAKKELTSIIRGNNGQWSVASESDGKELAVIEKRQNEANCSWC